MKTILKSDALLTACIVALSLTANVNLVASAADAPAADSAASPVGSPDSQAKDLNRPYKDDAVRHYNHAYDLHQQGFLNQAIAEYRAAIGADDRMEEAWTNLGLIYAAQRNYSKATEAFKKSLALRPTRPNALNGLGTVLYAQKKYKEAIEKWEEAVKADPKFASAYYNMGNAMDNEKDYAPAIENYVQALRIDSAMANPYYRIGSIYAKQKHFAQASLLLSKAIQLEPNAEFVHDAKKTLESMQDELAHDDGKNKDADVKMNVMAPPSSGNASTSNPATNGESTSNGSSAASGQTAGGASAQDKTW